MVKENFLHYIWESKRLSDKSLTLSNGETLEIISYGTYNDLSGPDFFNARLKIGQQQWAGNVEMHVQSSLWYTHGHEKDTAYGNVILHVVWQHDIEVFDYHQNKIPTLELKSVIDNDVVMQYTQLLEAPTKFIACEKSIINISKNFVNDWLTNTYIQRLEEKSQIILNELQKTQNDWEAVFFQFLMRSFGGNINGDFFESVAKSIPFSFILKELHSIETFEALLFGQANLLEDQPNDPYHSLLKKEHLYLKQKYNLSTTYASIQFFKLRPANFPTIRLSQLACLYYNHKKLFSKCINLKSVNEFHELFRDISTSAYWKNHYTFGKESSTKTKKISSSLVNLLWINTIVPIQYTYYKFLGRNTSLDCIDKLKNVPAEQNSVIEKFEKLGFNSKNAFHTQALLQLYKKYCTSYKCLECNIGKKILDQNINFDTEK